MTEITEQPPIDLSVPDDPVPGPWWRRSRVRLIAAAVVLALLGAGAAVILIKPKQVKVPGVAGLEYVSATRLVRQAGLHPRIEPVKSYQLAGQIVSQSPRRDARADDGSTVVLRMSLGPTVVAVPDVKGQTRGAATRTLREAGLGITITRGPSGSVPAGKVASTSPGASTQANRGSKITVTLSTGPERIKMPDLTGQRETVAEQTLQTSGLRVVIIHQESSATAGQVVSQTPKAGKRVKKGTTAHVVVATAAPAVTIPSVTGMDLNTAVSTLSGAGLRVEIVEQTTKQGKAGTVLSQSVPANASKPRGTTVSVTVARR